MRILLVSPQYKRLGNYIHNSELVYIGQYLNDSSLTITVLEFSSYIEVGLEIERHVPDYVLVHAGANNQQYLSVHSLLSEISNFGIPIVGVGVAINVHSSRLLCNISGLVATIPSDSCRDLPGLSELVELISKSYEVFPLLTDEFIKNSGINLGPKSVFPIPASTGCIHSCSFCCYNSIYNGHQARSINDVFSDIKLLHLKYQIDDIPFLDNNFGSDSIVNESRVLELVEKINIHSDQMNSLRLATNISLNGLSKDVLKSFAQLPHITLLTGIESFSKTTAIKFFAKPIDYTFLFEAAKYCDELGITMLCSYILFHPWSTIKNLRFELQQIDKLGRHRIPQLFVNSYIRFIPGTPLYDLQADWDKVYVINETISKFPDADVTNLYEDLRTFFSTRDLFDLQSITQYKIDEFVFLKQKLGVS